MNKKNEKNNNIATAIDTNVAGIFELDAAYFDVIGGGIGDTTSGPIVVI